MLLEEARTSYLELFEFETRGDGTTNQAMAICLLAFSGEPASSRNHGLEACTLMPQGMTESQNAESAFWFQDVDSDGRTVIKMPHLV